MMFRIAIQKLTGFISILLLILLNSCHRDKPVDNRVYLNPPYGNIKTLDQLVKAVAGIYHCKSDTVLSSVQSGNTVSPGPNEDLQVIRTSDSTLIIKNCTFRFLPGMPSSPAYTFLSDGQSYNHWAGFYLSNDSVSLTYTLWHMAGGGMYIYYKGRK